MLKLIILPLLLSLTSMHTAKWNENDITGKWMNADKNLEVEIYRYDNEFRAKVTWFDDSDDKTHPLNERTDINNPDKNLRSRKIVGMEIMQGLKYTAAQGNWISGLIYDPSSGKKWNACAQLLSTECLKVRGFWHIELLGQNIIFYKTKPSPAP